MNNGTKFLNLGLNCVKSTVAKYSPELRQIEFELSELERRLIMPQRVHL
jgi:hypothetical protein